MEMAEQQESFEAALRSLETAVDRLERGELSLDEALEWFERGVQNAIQCRRHLQAVDMRVEMLLKERDGALKAAPFEEE